MASQPREYENKCATNIKKSGRIISSRVYASTNFSLLRSLFYGAEVQGAKDEQTNLKIIIYTLRIYIFSKTINLDR